MQMTKIETIEEEIQSLMVPETQEGLTPWSPSRTAVAKADD